MKYTVLDDHTLKITSTTWDIETEDTIDYQFQDVNTLVLGDDTYMRAE